MNRDNRPYSGPVEAVNQIQRPHSDRPVNNHRGAILRRITMGSNNRYIRQGTTVGRIDLYMILMVPIHHRTVMVKTGIIAMVANRRSHRNILMHGVVALF